METLKLNPNNCIGVWLGSPKIEGAIWVKIHSVDSEINLRDGLTAFEDSFHGLDIGHLVITGFVCIACEKSLQVVLSLQ